MYPVWEWQRHADAAVGVSLGARGGVGMIFFPSFEWRADVRGMLGVCGVSENVLLYNSFVLLPADGSPRYSGIRVLTRGSHCVETRLAASLRRMLIKVVLMATRKQSFQILGNTDGERIRISQVSGERIGIYVRPNTKLQF